jgi:hypothetical protein
MVDASKKRLQNGVEQFRRQFGDQPTKALGAVLPSEVLQSLVTEEAGFFRERIYPPLTTLGLFIGQAMSADGACQDTVARRVSERCARGQAQAGAPASLHSLLAKKGPRKCRQTGILNLGPEWLLSSRFRLTRRRASTTAVSLVRNRCQLALVQGIYGLDKHRRGRSVGGAGVSSK